MVFSPIYGAWEERSPVIYGGAEEKDIKGHERNYICRIKFSLESTFMSYGIQKATNT